MPSKLHAYLLAFGVALAYGFWYILFSIIASYQVGIFAPIFPLIVIETISTLLNFTIARHELLINDKIAILYLLISGLLYAGGNYMLYLVMNSNGVSFASSFASAEIVVFTLALLLTERNNQKLKNILLGSILITLGLIYESLSLSTISVDLVIKLIEYGLPTAIFYGSGTFVYFLSTNKVKNKFTINFYIQASEVAIFLILISLVKVNISMQISSYYLLWLIAGGFTLFIAFYLNTTMMKVLQSFNNKTVVATGYIISDLMLLPILIYTLITNPSLWLSYTPGIILIIFGMSFLEWK